MRARSCVCIDRYLQRQECILLLLFTHVHVVLNGHIREIKKKINKKSVAAVRVRNEKKKNKTPSTKYKRASADIEKMSFISKRFGLPKHILLREHNNIYI